MNTELTQTPKTKFSLVPQTLEQAIEVAQRFAKSGMVPKLYQQGQDNPNAIDKILVAWELGGNLGLGLMQSLQGIAVINGNPSVWGDAALAIVMASGLLEDIDESQEGHCTVKRKGKQAKTSIFTMEDAKKAGLVGKPGPWSLYPKRMLQMRVRAFSLRDNFPDLLKGMTIAEEVQDYVNPYPDAVDANLSPTNNILDQPIIIEDKPKVRIRHTKAEMPIKENSNEESVEDKSLILENENELFLFTLEEESMIDDLIEVLPLLADGDIKSKLESIVINNFCPGGTRIKPETIILWHDKFCK